jgi:hypothetical protein
MIDRAGQRKFFKACATGISFRRSRRGYEGRLAPSSRAVVSGKGDDKVLELFWPGDGPATEARAPRDRVFCGITRS